MTQTLDDAIADLRAQRDALTQSLEATHRQLSSLEQQLVPIDAELRGLERAKNLLSQAIPPSAPVRHPVQSTILAYLEHAGAASEAKIVEDTELPQESAHQFLVRAVRSGKLNLSNERYSLSPSTTARSQEAAE